MLRGTYLILVGPEGGDGELGFQPAFAWKRSVSVIALPDRLTNGKSDKKKMSIGATQQCVPPFTCVRRHIPYGIGQRTLVHLHTELNVKRVSGTKSDGNKKTIKQETRDTSGERKNRDRLKNAGRIFYFFFVGSTLSHQSEG